VEHSSIDSVVDSRMPFGHDVVRNNAGVPIMVDAPDGVQGYAWGRWAWR